MNAGDGDVSVQFEMFNLFAAPLIDFRRELGEEIGADEARDLLREKAKELGMVFDEELEIGGQKLPRDWLLDYVETQVSGEPSSEIADVLGGHFWAGSWGAEEFQIPVFYAIITPFTPRKEFLGKLDYAIRRDFEPIVKMRPSSLKEAVRCFTYWARDMRDKDIADELLTQEGAYEAIRADSVAERDMQYRELVRRRTSKVRQLRKRFISCVTKMMLPVSRE